MIRKSVDSSRWIPTFTILVLTAAIVLSLGLASTPSSATAAEAQETPAENTASVAHFTTLQYKMFPWDDWDDLWVARISAEIDDHASLPALVEIAVPENAEVYRFGEPGEASPDFSPPWQMRTENGLDIYTGVLTHGRIVIIEYSLPDHPVVMTEAGPTIAITYTPLHNVDELHLITALPVDSAVVEPGFEYMGSGPSGEPAFASFFENAIGGQLYTTSIPYIEEASERQGIDNVATTVGIAGIAVLTAIALFFFFRRGASTKEDEE